MLQHNTEAQNLNPHWRLPTRRAACWHRCKVIGHRILRGVKNILDGPRCIHPSDPLQDAPVIAEHRSSLWLDGREDEFLLRCGKVENLRVAVSAFHGVVVPANAVLSFWRQLGKPVRRRGFVIGREIVNGCVVPTLGGGLCQLSNALASAASQAGIELIERHHHSASIEGQQMTTLVDATVAWNYVDLRLSAEVSFRIEAWLSRDELVVRIRARKPGSADPSPAQLITRQPQESRPVARGCLTCDESKCFLYRRGERPLAARTAVLVNEYQPELQRWLQANTQQPDWMLPWLRPSRRAKGWLTTDSRSVAFARFASWKRMLWAYLSSGEGGSRQTLRTHSALWLAKAYARKLKPEHIELVISQDLLVPLWRLGVLAGREVTVLVSELPASTLQQRLDLAASQHPQAQSLVDFRVDERWQTDEWAALAYGKRLLTPHRQIHRILTEAGLTAQWLPWVIPDVSTPVAGRSSSDSPLTLVLAASALARKGADDVLAVARKLKARVLVLGSPPANQAAWAAIDWQQVGYASDWPTQADVVVLPAYIEHQPRALLQALAMGLPVVASTACGLTAQPGLMEIEAGDTQALEQAIRSLVWAQT